MHKEFYELLAFNRQLICSSLHYVVGNIELLTLNCFLYLIAFKGDLTSGYVLKQEYGKRNMYLRNPATHIPEINVVATNNIFIIPDTGF